MGLCKWYLVYSLYHPRIILWGIAIWNPWKLWTFGYDWKSFRFCF